MKDKFKKWLIEKENKSPGTANSYSGGIDRLSEHLTNVALKKYTDLYTIDDIDLLKKYSEWYGLRGNYSGIGDSGHGTWRNAIKAFVRFREGNPNVRARQTYKSTPSSTYRQPSAPKTISIKDYDFESVIKEDASEMSNYYGLLYCLEVSLRKIVNISMTKGYGENWWNERISPYIRNNVDKKIKTEDNRIYSKKSIPPLSYTTFRELRMIVEDHWHLFSSQLKNKRDFIKITEDLNVIRNNVAHSVMLPEDEKLRLKLALKDWFRLMK
jgi:hypothetical protein